MESATNLIRLNSNSELKMTPEGDFFRAWVEFLRPIHKLTNTEMGVLAALLKKRYELSKKYNDPEDVDEKLMGKKAKKEIMEECNLTSKYFKVILTKFRKNRVIENNKIFLHLVPSLTKDGAGLLIYFDFKDEQRTKTSL